MAEEFGSTREGGAVPQGGLEPPTHALRMRVATICGSHIKPLAPTCCRSRTFIAVRFRHFWQLGRNPAPLSPAPERVHGGAHMVRVMVSVDFDQHRSIGHAEKAGCGPSGRRPFCIIHVAHVRLRSCGVQCSIPASRSCGAPCRLEAANRPAVELDSPPRALPLPFPQVRRARRAGTGNGRGPLARLSGALTRGGTARHLSVSIHPPCVLGMN